MLNNKNVLIKIGKRGIALNLTDKAIPEKKALRNRFTELGFSEYFKRNKKDITQEKIFQGMTLLVRQLERYLLGLEEEILPI